MKKSGYYSILHIYFIFFIVSFSVIIFVTVFSFSIISINTSTGSVERSNYPKEFTENFCDQIIFTDDIPQVKQSGLELLKSNQSGIQILNDRGQEIFSYQKSRNMKNSYSNTDLLHLYQAGHIDGSQTTLFIGTLSHNENNYTYIIHFPMNISKITMYLNGDRFTTGKRIILLCLSVVFLIMLVAGFVYGFWITKIINCISLSIKNIAQRYYTPLTNSGVFSNVFESLNRLDMEIKTIDKIKEEKLLIKYKALSHNGTVLKLDGVSGEPTIVI